MIFSLEIIGFSIEGCLSAQRTGADRIELCDNPGDGGTTPSYGFIKAARKALHIALYPIIRPRGGDFLYSKEEYEIMKADVKLCKKLGCDGIVTGILLKNGSVDTERCLALAELAYPIGTTFHRAFDRTDDPLKAMEDIIECGYERILTSGHKPTALEGAEMIASLIKLSDERIVIMPGSGIRSENIAEIALITKAIEFHTSARTITSSSMEFIQGAMKENLNVVSVDENEIKK